MKASEKSAFGLSRAVCVYPPGAERPIWVPERCVRPIQDEPPGKNSEGINTMNDPDWTTEN